MLTAFWLSINGYIMPDTIKDDDDLARAFCEIQEQEGGTMMFLHLNDAAASCDGAVQCATLCFGYKWEKLTHAVSK